MRLVEGSSIVSTSSPLLFQYRGNQFAVFHGSFILLLPVLAPFDMKTVLHSVLVGAFRLLRGIYCVVLYPNPRERLPSLAPSLVFWHCSASPLLSMHWGGGIVPAIRCIRGFHDGRPLIPALSNRGTAPWFLHLCSLWVAPPCTLNPDPRTLFPALGWVGYSADSSRVSTSSPLSSAEWIDPPSGEVWPRKWNILAVEGVNGTPGN